VALLALERAFLGQARCSRGGAEYYLGEAEHYLDGAENYLGVAQTGALRSDPANTKHALFGYSREAL